MRRRSGPSRGFLLVYRGNKQKQISCGNDSGKSKSKGEKQVLRLRLRMTI